MARLTPEQRDFFQIVSEATFANPFDQRRLALDARMAGLEPGATREEIDPYIVPELERAWAELGEDVQWTDFEGADADLVMHAMLFDTFWRHQEALDEMIAAQRAAGAEPVPVPFAQDALGRLRRWGFDEAMSRRYFGIMYQIRRAYVFIMDFLPGPSSSMRALRKRLWVNIFTDDLELYENHMWNRMEDFSTFLLGETGTGKGTAARALGMAGWIPFDEQRGRFAETFEELWVPINLSQFTASLIESELFGHVKGAFTGAIKDHDGVFGRCRRYGTIFLDEIGEVDLPIQIKLLNVLQDREYMPVGSHEPRRFEGRVIAATNRSITAQREEGSFRDDFFYRLCSDIIVMPTLRQRIDEDPEELDILTHTIVERLVGAPSPGLVERVREAIDRDLGPTYPWYGNVRELEQCVRRVILTGSYRPDRAALSRSGRPADHLADQMAAGALTIDEVTGQYCAMLYERLNSYERVAERVGVDRRTVKRYIELVEDP